MEIELIRSILSVAAFATFAGIVAWAYAPSRRGTLDRQAASIFGEDDA